MTGETKMDNNKVHEMNNNRSFTSEQLSKWGAMGGAPRRFTEEEINQIGVLLVEWLQKDENIFFEEFFLQHGIYRKLLYEYADRYESFSAILKVAKQIQEHKLAKGGLLGKYRDASTIFLLKNYHNMADKVEQQVTNTNAPVVINLSLPESKTPKQVEHQEHQELLPGTSDIEFKLPGVLPDAEPGSNNEHQEKAQDEATDGVLPDEEV